MVDANTSLCCGVCKIFLCSQEYVFFYVKQETNVHIAVKPECEQAARTANTLVFKKVACANPVAERSAFKKTEEVICRVCENSVGSVVPQGPGGQSFIALGRDHIELCTVPPQKKSNNKKAPKFYQVYKSTTQWDRIERRNDANFFPSLSSLPTASAAGGSGSSSSASSSSPPSATSSVSAISSSPVAFSSSTAAPTRSTTTAPNPTRNARSSSTTDIVLFVPDTSLVLPDRRLNVPSGAISSSEYWVSGGATEHGQALELLDSSVGWASSLTESAARDYQARAYLEALRQDLIVVMPTGAGKTLVAAMVVKRFKLLNPQHLAVFVVDRVPLVFQQGEYLRRETGLRVCCLCGENRTLHKVRALNGCHYDVLVVTAGALDDMIEKQQIDLNLQACCVVFDECHHAVGGHVYARLLRRVFSPVRGAAQRARPRVLGLSASPVSGTTRAATEKRLFELRELFGNAGVLYPAVPPARTDVNWVLISRTDAQVRLAQKVLRSYVKPCVARVNMLVSGNRAGGGSSGSRSGAEAGGGAAMVVLERCEEGSEDWDHILNPATLGRVRGQLESIRFYILEEADRSRAQWISLLVEILRSFLAALEASEVMGSRFACVILREVLDMYLTGPRAEGVEGDQGWFIAGIANLLRVDVAQLERSYGGSAGANSPTEGASENGVSPRLVRLVAELEREITSDNRVLVIVHTRVVARQLGRYLNELPHIQAAFRAQTVVGHGGFDGMAWFGEQEQALLDFRADVCRALVSTSVLEEGLDVAHCGLVVRMQGVQSLIGFVQSRGRARREDSRMLVFVSDADRDRCALVQQQETVMRSIVEEQGRVLGLPSAEANNVFNLLDSHYSSGGQYEAAAERAREFVTATENQRG